MISFRLIVLIFAGLASDFPLMAQTIHLEKIEGGVWYRKTAQAAEETLQARADIQPGFLRTAADGSFYGSTGPGSKFRLGPDSEVEIKGVRPVLPCGLRDALAMSLAQGKLTAYDVPGSKAYEVHLPGGRVCMASTLCVLCMHGAAGHVYVAKGQVQLFPNQGIYHQAGLLMKARPTVAVLNGNGVLEIQPLINAAPGTSNCLLSGASPEIAAAIQEGSPSLGNLPGNPPVSPTQ